MIINNVIQHLSLSVIDLRSSYSYSLWRFHYTPLLFLPTTTISTCRPLSCERLKIGLIFLLPNIGRSSCIRGTIPPTLSLLLTIKHPEGPFSPKSCLPSTLPLWFLSTSYKHKTVTDWYLKFPFSRTRNRQPFFTLYPVFLEDVLISTPKSPLDSQHPKNTTVLFFLSILILLPRITTTRVRITPTQDPTTFPSSSV